MAFITKDDFKGVCDPMTLEVIGQADDRNLARAIGYAQEEVSSYLRSRYDVVKTFQKEGDERNAQLVMIVCDVALYHLVAWLPKRIGFEIRETRYNNAISWLKDVQAGRATPDLDPLTNDDGVDIGNSVRFSGWDKSEYRY